MDPKNIGVFIAKKRREKNLTQEQLAEILNVSNKTISKWERGKSMPDYAIVEQLCKELDMTAGELLAGQESDSTEAQDEEKYPLLQYKLEQAESKIVQLEHKKNHSATTHGIGFGCALAMIISYVNWQSIGWAILHGLLGWIYVIYYVIRYLL